MFYRKNPYLLGETVPSITDPGTIYRCESKKINLLGMAPTLNGSGSHHQLGNTRRPILVSRQFWPFWVDGARRPRPRPRCCWLLRSQDSKARGSQSAKRRQGISFSCPRATATGPDGAALSPTGSGKQGRSAPVSSGKPSILFLRCTYLFYHDDAPRVPHSFQLRPNGYCSDLPVLSCMSAPTATTT